MGKYSKIETNLKFKTLLVSRISIRDIQPVLPISPFYHLLTYPEEWVLPDLNIPLNFQDHLYNAKAGGGGRSVLGICSQDWPWPVLAKAQFIFRSSGSFLSFVSNLLSDCLSYTWKSQREQTQGSCLQEYSVSSSFPLGVSFLLHLLLVVWGSDSTFPPVKSKDKNCMNSKDYIGRFFRWVGNLHFNSK